MLTSQEPSSKGRFFPCEEYLNEVVPALLVTVLARRDKGPKEGVSTVAVEITEAIAETIVEDGYVVNVETGEVVSGPEPEEYVCDTLEKADWVLSVMAEEQASVLAVDARLAALSAHLEKQKKKHEARVKYLQWKFGPSIAHLAKETLAASKGKTVTLDHGEVKLRTSKGTNTIINMDAALEWAQANVPDIIKTVRSVNVSDILLWHDDSSPCFVESTGPVQKVTIYTGVGPAIEVLKEAIPE